MASAPAGEPRGEEDSASSGVAASLLVGWAMIGVYLASAVLQVYENEALNSFYFYPSSSQFAFLRSIFPSPAFYDLIAWQNIVLFEAVPFLLFFYLAVRMRVDPLSKIWSTLVAAAVVGVVLSILNSVLVSYQPNISHLLLDGSFSVPNLSSPGWSSVILSLLSTPWILLENGAVFAALAITGISFGSFSGETPYWIVRRMLNSFERGPDEDGAATDDQEHEASSSAPKNNSRC